MLLDLHTHTCRYSPCSSFTPEGIVQSAIDSGLNGIVLTEHDAIWGQDEVNELKRQFPDFTILRGIEVTSEGGDHFLVYGDLNPELFSPWTPVDRLISLARRSGYYIALAHPYRYSDDVPAEIRTTPVNALEGMSSNIRRYTQQKIKSLASELDIPLIAGSDGHTGATVGMSATRFPAPIRNEQELVEALRAGGFTLYRNEDKIQNANAQIEEQLDLARRLRKEGYSIREIHRNFGVSYTLLLGLENGWDVLL